jgi:SAM-dependent methyltransferase
MLEAVVNGARSRPGNYAEQARTYDYTRGASPTIVRALLRFLGEPGGRTVLDVAGGTGNYGQVLAARGFRVIVVDASPEMLEHAARKLGRGACVVGDALRLPVRDAGVDAATFVHGLHLIEDQAGALAELRRVLRAGPAVVVDPTSENAALFIHEYFGRDPSPSRGRPSIETIVGKLRSAGFARIEHEQLVFTDSVDGSLHALHTSAMHLAGPAYLRNTSFWATLDEETRRAGLAALARDLRSGVLQQRVEDHMRQAVVRGHETVFAAWP